MLKDEFPFEQLIRAGKDKTKTIQEQEHDLDKC